MSKEDKSKGSNVVERNKRGYWVKGQSGNPAGRPKGSKNAITLLRQSLELQLREQAAPDMGSVLDKAIELAQKGDRQMIKLLLDKHMHAGDSGEAKASDKVAIQINAAPSAPNAPDPEVNVIQPDEETNEDEQ